MSQNSLRFLHEHKRLEDIINALRKELRAVNDTLGSKEIECSTLQKDIEDRDGSLKFIKMELKKLKEVAQQKSCSGTTALGGISSSSTAAHRQMERCDSSDRSEIILLLQNDLSQKDKLLTECRERLRFFQSSIRRLQQECLAKDTTIVELQNEIDKFRQVVRPLTQVFLEHHKELNWNPGIESTRVFNVNEPRMKRQGYSAEPLSEMVDADNELIKIPKSQV